MKRGDVVFRPRDGAIGTVVCVEQGATVLVVSVDGEERRWGRSTCRSRSVTHGPKGVTKASARQLEAARMMAEGRPCTEVAEHFGISPHTVYRWLQDVRAAVDDARQMVALAVGYLQRELADDASQVEAGCEIGDMLRPVMPPRFPANRP